MNNQEILQKIVAYIEAIMVDKSMTSRDLAEICAKKSGKMSPRTIDKMFMHTATFRGHQGRVLRPDRAILSGQS